MANVSGIYVNNAGTQDIAQLTAALAYLNTSPTAAAVINQFAALGSTSVTIIHDGIDGQKSGVVSWDPISANGVLRNDSPSVVMAVQSAALGLLHEMAHALDYSPNSPDSQFQYSRERTAIGLENAAATELGEPQRDNHDGLGINTTNATEHTGPPSESGSENWVAKDSAGGDHVGSEFTPFEKPAPDSPTPQAPIVPGSDLNVGSDRYSRSTVDAPDTTGDPFVGGSTDVGGIDFGYGEDWDDDPPTAGGLMEFGSNPPPYGGKPVRQGMPIQSPMATDDSGSMESYHSAVARGSEQFSRATTNAINTSGMMENTSFNAENVRKSDVLVTMMASFMPPVAVTSNISNLAVARFENILVHP